MQELKSKKINKNFPCPCGSGKKYKDCCQIKDIEKEKNYQEEAQKAYQLYYQYANSIKDKKSLLVKLVSIASEYIKENKLIESKILYQKCLEIGIKYNFPEAETACKIILDTIDNNILDKEKHISFNNENINLKLEKSNESDIELDFIISLAENYKNKGLLRESAYFFEETFWKALKSNNKEKQSLSLSKLGTLLNKSNGYNDAKTFYNLIFFARPRKIDFACSSSGACCKNFLTNISLKDLAEILKNKPELKAEDFLNFNQDNHLIDFIINKEDKNLDSKVLTLKKKDDMSCIFLENNKCSIYNFRPSVCKNWPMFLDKEGYLSYQKSMNHFIKSSCNHCVIPNKNNHDEIEKSLKYHNYYSNFKEVSFLENLLRDKYLDDIDKLLVDKLQVDNEVLEILLKFVYQLDDYFKTILEKISPIKDVVKINTSYFLKDSFTKSIIIAVYTTANIDETIKLISENLSGLKQEINNKYISVFVDDYFKSEIYVYPANEIDKKILCDEIVLFEKNNNLPVKFKNKISIPENKEVYIEILKTVKTVLKHELKQKNLINVKEIIENIIGLYKNVVDNNNLELADLITEEFLNIQDIYLSEIEKFLSLDEYFSELNLFLNYLNLFNDNNLFFDYSCKNLIYLCKTNSEKSLLIIQEIENIISSLDYEKQKIFINNILKENILLNKFTEHKIICNLLLETYKIELGNLSTVEKVKYLKVFFDIYKPEYFDNFEEEYNLLLEDFIEYRIISHQIENIQFYIEILLNKTEKAKDKFELLLKIADLYLDEDYKKEAIETYEKALQSSSSYYYVNDRLVVLQILIDLNIKIKDYKQGEFIINKLIKLSEKNDKEHTKIYAIVNLLKINYINDKNINLFDFIKSSYTNSDDDDVELILYTYFENTLTEKLHILTEDLKTITKQFFDIVPEINNEKSLKKSNILKFLENITNVLALILELYYLNFILSNFDLEILSDEIIKLHLNSMLYKEFNDINNSIPNMEKLIEIYSSFSDKDMDLLSFFIFYLGNLFESQGNDNKAKEYFIDASNTSLIEVNKNISNIYKMYIDFKNSIDDISFVVLSEFYEILTKQLSNMNLDSDNDTYIKDLIKTMQNIKYPQI